MAKWLDQPTSRSPLSPPGGHPAVTMFHRGSGVGHVRRCPPAVSAAPCRGLCHHLPCHRHPLHLSSDVVPDIDEKAIGDRAGGDARMMTRRIAVAKADALLANPVLSADLRARGVWLITGVRQLDIIFGTHAAHTGAARGAARGTLCVPLPPPHKQTAQTTRLQYTASGPGGDGRRGGGTDPGEAAQSCRARGVPANVLKRRAGRDRGRPVRARCCDRGASRGEPRGNCQFCRRLATGGHRGAASIPGAPVLCWRYTAFLTFTSA